MGIDKEAEGSATEGRSQNGRQNSGTWLSVKKKKKKNQIALEFCFNIY